MAKKSETSKECDDMVEEAAIYIAQHSSLRQAEIFFDEFDRMLGVIERQPGIGTKCQYGMRRIHLGKFRSYNIYYMERDDIIEIVGIHHTSRGTEFLEDSEG